MPVPVLVATAKVVLAWVFAGRGPGIREGGVQVLDLLTTQGNRTGPVIKQALAAVEAELVSIVAAESIDDDSIEPAMLAVQDLFVELALTVDELAQVGFDFQRAATELLHRGRQLLGAAALSASETYLTERAVYGCYRAILSRPELLPGRDNAFQRSVLDDLKELRSELPQLGEQLAQQVLALVADHQQSRGHWPVPSLLPVSPMLIVETAQARLYFGDRALAERIALALLEQHDRGANEGGAKHRA